jgi:DNA polymerase III psi subunit
MGQKEKMNLTPVLEALGVKPLRLRARPAQPETPAIAEPVAPAPTPEKRIALLRAQAEVNQPALAALYTKITEAISQLGLQCVRVADAEGDPHVRVLAFGDAELPAGIEAGRVQRVDALATLDADRGRKRALWEAIQKLAREAGAG